jgi:hypothetical protein
MVRD